MSAPILTTKLYIPPARPDVAPRPRLVERLNEGLALGRKLTLVAAPAGFGKTTLVSAWVHSGIGSSKHDGAEAAVSTCTSPAPLGVAWLSLDAEDSEPARFLTYLVMALQTVRPNLGAGVLAALQSPPPPPLTGLLAALLNEIAAAPEPFLLVLDDYHVLDSPPVDAALTFLLDHLPSQGRLVIASREDPDLPLARLRARGQLTELRAAELRFTAAEAADFLNRVMGLGLSEENVFALEARTEGWVAGLQLAALSMRGRQDAAAFIASFSGSHRFVLDYLVEEVLQRQPDRVRRFLLHTAILDRLCGPLCDAVAGQEDGGAMLEALERGNLFVAPLDDQRRWYRYHHLFAEALRARLMAEQPAEVPALHRRASVWCEQHGLPSGAIRHALAAGDFERAAGLIELAWPVMDQSSQSATWLDWATALPDALVRKRPVLSVGYAWALLDSGDLDAGETRLREVEQWLAMTGNPAMPAPGMIVVDEAQFRSLPATIASARAYLSQAFGDVPGTVTYASRVLDLLPEEEHLKREQATALLGLAHWANGDLEAAQQTLGGFMTNMRKAGRIPDATAMAFVLAAIKVSLGRLHEAARIYDYSLQLAETLEDPLPAGTSDLHRGLGALYLEWNDPETAARHVRVGEKLGAQAALPGWPHRLCVTQARLKEVQDDLDGALVLLDEAERCYARTPLLDARPIGALKARIWVRQGRMSEALDWVRKRSLSVGDDFSYPQEFEYLTLARVLIARYQSDRAERFIAQALEVLARLLHAAEKGQRTGGVIEILALQALAHQAQDRLPQALAALERALTLAEPEAYVRVFVDEGPLMAALLREAVKQGVALDYAGALYAAFPKTEGGSSAAQPLIEPLSERELEVLRLLRTELSGPEIARELVVSLNTLRTHTKNIYSKLGVNSRRSAVLRAGELGLL